MVLAGKAQQEEIGDGANLVVSFAGELLQGAEDLIQTGLHPSEIIIGYTKAINKVNCFSRHFYFYYINLYLDYKTKPE